MSRLIWGLAAAVGLVVGGMFGLAAFGSPPGPQPAATPAETPSPSPTPAVPVAPAPKPEQDLLLVWTPGGLPDGFDDAVSTLPGVVATTIVAGDTVDLLGSADADGHPIDALEPGWAIPLDAIAIDPESYGGVLPKGGKLTVDGLRRGEALLGETSASLRGLGPGATIHLDGDLELVVTGVVDDTLVGAAEIVLHRGDAEAAGITTARFLLVTYRGDRAEIEALVRGVVPDGISARLRGPGETPYLRHGDAVLPQALVKATFGEFAYQPPAEGERDFVQERAFIDAHIVSVAVPILGTVRCHRGIVAQLEGALGELESRGLAHLVDPAQYAGCWAARLVAPGAGVSRHAWGITVDVNADHNPTGVGSGQDPRLVETMARWGFTWGGFWLVPDPMHFEYIGPPDPDARVPER